MVGYRCVCDVGYRLSANGTGCEWSCGTVDTVGCSGPGQNGCADGCDFGTCVDGLCRCWAGYTGVGCNVTVARPNEGSPLGIGLSGVGGGNWAFVDAMRMARPWVSINDKDRYSGQFSYQGNSLVFANRQYEWGNGVPMDLSTATDFPLTVRETQALIVLMARDVCKHAVDGRYVLLYEGEGEVDLGMDARAVAFQSGRIDFDFIPTCTPSCWASRGTWPY